MRAGDDPAGGMDQFDIFVIGGGVNGCGIARDAAGRGFTVALAEMNDLGSGTSSWSTKLIHGGLRYLEHYEFRLVREALREREVLWRIAPHIVRPLRFVLPHHNGLRPAWLLRAGLFLYDNLGGRARLPGTATVDLAGPLGAPLKAEFRRGFEYSDAQVDDTRLVVVNARDARRLGAAVHTRTEVTEARREGEGWLVALRARDGSTREVRARFLVNAAGPWVDRVIEGALGVRDAHNIRLVKGSHIVTRRLYDHDRAYIFQNEDGRIIFLIPYQGDFTLVGTTDLDYQGDPGKAMITEEETDYLLKSAGEYLETPISREDIRWSFSGVRPLVDDHAGKAQEATRDYVLRTEGHPGEGALVQIFGGKITTYRRLAEDVVHIVEKRLGRRGASWTGSKPLPGGDFPVDGVEALERELSALAPLLAPATARRLVALYGTDALAIARAGLGRDLGHGLTEGEVRFLQENEWAVSAEDILWRRTKLGLVFSRDECVRLDQYLRQQAGSGVSRAASAA